MERKAARLGRLEAREPMLIAPEATKLRAIGATTPIHPTGFPAKNGVAKEVNQLRRENNIMNAIMPTGEITETQALEIPNALDDLEQAIEILNGKIKTLTETLRYVCREYRTDEPEACWPSAIRVTGLGQRIDKSVTSVQNANTQLQTILDLIQI